MLPPMIGQLSNLATLNVCRLWVDKLLPSSPLILDSYSCSSDAINWKSFLKKLVIYQIWLSSMFVSYFFLDLSHSLKSSSITTGWKSFRQKSVNYRIWLSSMFVIFVCSPRSKSGTFLTIQLERNQLVELPAEIGQLSKLITFNVRRVYEGMRKSSSLLHSTNRISSNQLYKNGLTSLPEEFGELFMLEELNVRHRCERWIR